MTSFNRIKFNPNYFVREENDQVVFFSGITRFIHFISKEAYEILKEAEEKSSDKIMSMYCEDEEDKKKISDFFGDLIDKQIIKAE